MRRFVALFPTRRFPRPADLLAMNEQAIRGAGFSQAKVAALRDLAAKTLDGTVPTGAIVRKLDDEAIIERLIAVRGIGRWTVEMLLIFQLGRPDVLPVDDFGVRNGFRIAYGRRSMPMPKEVRRYGERWKPYRTAAAWYLWRAADHAKGIRMLKKTASGVLASAQRPQTLKNVKRRSTDGTMAVRFHSTGERLSHSASLPFTFDKCSHVEDKPFLASPLVRLEAVFSILSSN